MKINYKAHLLTLQSKVETLYEILQPGQNNYKVSIV